MMKSSTFIASALLLVVNGVLGAPFTHPGDTMQLDAIDKDIANNWDKIVDTWKDQAAAWFAQHKGDTSRPHGHKWGHHHRHPHSSIVSSVAASASASTFSKPVPSSTIASIPSSSSAPLSSSSATAVSSASPSATHSSSVISSSSAVSVASSTVASVPTPNASQAAYLDPHNAIRSTKGAKSLVWSDKLASYAQNWANKCQWKHSNGPYGENLAAGTGGMSVAAGIKLWVDEEGDYNADAPVASHYTQVVWKGSSQIGCAMAVCDGLLGAGTGKANYYVCSYDAPGNVLGQFQQNVEA